MRLNSFCLLLCGVSACTSDPVSNTDIGSTGTSSTTTTTGDDTTAPTSTQDGLPDSGSSGAMPPGPICGNNIIDGADICDGTDLGEETCSNLGFETGELGCTGNCGGYDLTGCGFFVCGDGSEDGEEDCDGTVGNATCVTAGFDNGTLFCTATCEYDTSLCGICGNGIIEDGGEDCDIKGELNASCGSLGFMTGTLLCGDDCLFDTALCSTCGNDLTEGTENCDGLDVPGLTCASEGFDSGTLGCQASCQYDFTACGTCGNNLQDGDETCDGGSFGAATCVTEGFDNGSLTCNAACDTITTENCGVCGNAVIDGSEVCDAALLGGQSCAALGLQGGVLACNANCGYDFSGCDIQVRPIFLTSSNGIAGFYAYDITTDTWETLPNPPITTHSQITNNGTVVHLMGDDNVIYDYDPIVETWSAGIAGPGVFVANPIGFFQWYADGFYYLKDGESTMHVYSGGAWSNFDLGTTGSCAGSYDADNNRLYIRTYNQMGFSQLDTTTDTVLQIIVNATGVGENSRTGSYYNGNFYVRTFTETFFRIDTVTGLATDTGALPLSQHTGTATDFLNGMIYVSGYGATPTSFQVLDTSDDSITTLADQPSVSNHSTITVLRTPQ